MERKKNQRDTQHGNGEPVRPPCERSLSLLTPSPLNRTSAVSNTCDTPTPISPPHFIQARRFQHVYVSYIVIAYNHIKILNQNTHSEAHDIEELSSTPGIRKKRVHADTRHARGTRACYATKQPQGVCSTTIESRRGHREHVRVRCPCVATHTP
jgi:hypothetical protein